MKMFILQDPYEGLKAVIQKDEDKEDRMTAGEFFSGLGELGLSVGSAAAAEPVSGIAGIAAGALPGDPGQSVKAIEAVQDIMTFKPGEKGQRAAEAIADLIPETVKRGLGWVGEKHEELSDIAAEKAGPTFGPYVGTLMKTLPAAAAEVSPLKVARKVQKAGGLGQVAGRGFRAAERGVTDIVEAGKGAIMPGISTPVERPLMKSQASIAPEKWGGKQPHGVEWTHEQKLEDLSETLGPSKGAEQIQKGIQKPTGKEEAFIGAEEWREAYADNPQIRELTAMYNRQGMSIDEVERLFNENVNRIDGESVFDKTLYREVERRAGQMDREPFTIYKESDEPISGKRTSNIKTAGEIHDLDTSKGCIGFCPECYSAYGSKKQFCARPVAMRLTGHFSDNPDLIRRIGTNGEPNMNPHHWNQYAEEFEDLMRQGKVDQKTLDEFMDDAYDWSYTQDQVKNVGLDTPGHWEGKDYIKGGRDQTFYITKLQSLRNFDPEVIRNLEVSLDPQMPSHFFKSLKNVEELKKMDPSLNIMLRIRSLSSYSDEINALQKMGVDFANKHELPVLETRLRFKKKDTAAMAQLQPEYKPMGGEAQYKHMSYYPSEKPDFGLYEPAGDQLIKRVTSHTDTGPVEVDMHLQRDANPTIPSKGGTESKYDDASKYWKDKAEVWSVWDKGERVADNMNELDARHFVGEEMADRHPDIVPGKEKIMEYALHESPLSQMGLKPNLHKQCGTFNNPLCTKCKACRAWINEGRAKAEIMAKDTELAQSGKR